MMVAKRRKRVAMEEEDKKANNLPHPQEAPRQQDLATLNFRKNLKLYAIRLATVKALCRAKHAARVLSRSLVDIHFPDAFKQMPRKQSKLIRDEVVVEDTERWTCAWFGQQRHGARTFTDHREADGKISAIRAMGEAKVEANLTLSILFMEIWAMPLSLLDEDVNLLGSQKLHIMESCTDSWASRSS